MGQLVLLGFMEHLHHDLFRIPVLGASGNNHPQPQVIYQSLVQLLERVGFILHRASLFLITHADHRRQMSCLAGSPVFLHVLAAWLRGEAVLEMDVVKVYGRFSFFQR